MKKLIFGIVAAGMLAVGGLGYAATQSLAPAPAQAVTQAAPAPASAVPTVGTESATASDVSEPKEAVDTDNVDEQVGDQTTPDIPGQAEEAESATDTDNVQEQVGDQNTPDVPGQAEEAEPAAALGAGK